MLLLIRERVPYCLLLLFALLLPDFFLLGMLKGKVYRTKPRKMNAIASDVLATSFRNMEKHVHVLPVLAVKSTCFL